MSTNYLPSEPTLYLLEVLQRSGIGAVTVRKIAREILKTRNKNFDDVNSTLLYQNLGESPEYVDKARYSRDQIVSACQNNSIFIISMLDTQYPPLLRGVEDAPPIIYVKGELHSLQHSINIAVVGTRKASDVGLKWAHAIARYLAELRITVVSGLALGIDTAAHTGSLSAGGITVSILAHGLDMVAPSTNKELALSILNSGGALVSEHPPGVPPRPPEFVRRNRIQSGISSASIIVETGITGGSIHQANFTVSQRRELFVVLPAANSPHREHFNDIGGKMLVQQINAKSISRKSDILNMVTSLDPSRYSKQTTTSRNVNEQLDLDW